MNVIQETSGNSYRHATTCCKSGSASGDAGDPKMQIRPTMTRGRMTRGQTISARTENIVMMSTECQYSEAYILLRLREFSFKEALIRRYATSILCGLCCT